MIVSGIIELIVEVPVFVAQVFCFVKLRVVLDTLNLFVRSVIFVALVVRDPGQAIFAFSIAQVASTITFVIGYYIYFIYYTDKLKRTLGTLKRTADSSNDHQDSQTSKKHSEPDDFIPFNSVKQMFPGYLHNPVSIYTHYTCENYQLMNEISISFAFRARYSTKTFKHLFGVSLNRDF